MTILRAIFDIAVAAVLVLGIVAGSLVALVAAGAIVGIPVAVMVWIVRQAL